MDNKSVYRKKQTKQLHIEKYAYICDQIYYILKSWYSHIQRQENQVFLKFKQLN